VSPFVGSVPKSFSKSSVRPSPSWSVMPEGWGTGAIANGSAPFAPMPKAVAAPAPYGPAPTPMPKPLPAPKGPTPAPDVDGTGTPACSGSSRNLRYAPLV
jgi:hypothetical protein